MDLCISVDSYHAGDKQTRRSRTRFMIYINMSLINWYSKKQSIAETSVFGAKFVAMKKNRNVVSNLIQVEDDGHSHIWGLIYLWTKNVAYP